MATSVDDMSLDDLLAKAKESLVAKSKQTKQSDDLEQIRKSWQQLPKLEPGLALPSEVPRKGPVKLGIVASGPHKSHSQSLRVVSDPIKVKLDAKAARESTAGSKWFNMPKPELTTAVKRDLQLLQMRNVLDPKRHYKKDKGPLPTYFQTGTIIEGNTEFYSARLTQKERKKTIVDEILADTSYKTYFKRKYLEIQGSKRSGRKEFYKKVKEMRK